MFGNFAFEFNRSYYEFPQLELWEWRTSLVYTLPLFDQFDQEVARRRAVAERKLSEVRQNFSEKSAIAQMQAQKDNLQIAWKNWLERKDALKISQDLYRYTLRQFNSGSISVNELFVDQDRLLRTEQVANEGLYQLHSSTLAFCHSRGMSYSKSCL
jgi:outer membrane protein TolC